MMNEELIINGLKFKKNKKYITSLKGNKKMKIK